MKPFLLLALVVAVGSALEDPQARLLAIDKEASEKKEAYMREWLSRAKLDPIPVPTPANPKDARPSEKKAFNLATKTNEVMAEAKRIREGRDKEGMSHAEGELMAISREKIQLILAAQKP